MGEGTFGSVLECWDREEGDFVTIKVVRSLEKYRSAAMVEIDALNLVARDNRKGSRCVQIRGWFDYRGHICIVFEKLGPSLYDFLRKNNCCPFPLALVREIGYQLLEDMHDLHLIHTDLKPENILLISSDSVKVPSCKRGTHGEMHFMSLPKSSAIKLIDFGSTIFANRDRSSIVSTRHYRAPEIILGLGWSYPCDMWSVGCVLVELFLGTMLFQTHEDLEHLAIMERVLGPIPDHLIKKFRHGAKLNWPKGAASEKV